MESVQLFPLKWTNDYLKLSEYGTEENFVSSFGLYGKRLKFYKLHPLFYVYFSLHNETHLWEQPNMRKRPC